MRHHGAGAAPGRGCQVSGDLGLGDPPRRSGPSQDAANPGQPSRQMGGGIVSGNSSRTSFRSTCRPCTVTRSAASSRTLRRWPSPVRPVAMTAAPRSAAPCGDAMPGTGQQPTREVPCRSASSIALTAGFRMSAGHDRDSGGQPAGRRERQRRRGDSVREEAVLNDPQFCEPGSLDLLCVGDQALRFV